MIFQCCNFVSALKCMKIDRDISRYILILFLFENYVWDISWGFQLGVHRHEFLCALIRGAIICLVARIPWGLFCWSICLLGRNKSVKDTEHCAEVRIFHVYFIFYITDVSWELRQIQITSVPKCGLVIIICLYVFNFSEDWLAGQQATLCWML